MSSKYMAYLESTHTFGPFCLPPGNLDLVCSRGPVLYCLQDVISNKRLKRQLDDCLFLAMISCPQQLHHQEPNTLVYIRNHLVVHYKRLHPGLERV